MKVVRGQRGAQSLQSASVATIGNFDGVHLGHRQLLQQVRAEADRMQAKAVAILFEPHPAEFFLDEPPARLMTLREKLLPLEQLGVDVVRVLRFNQDLAAMSANEFIDRILVNELNVQHLVVGDDFRFGHRRAGDFELLQADGRFSCEASDTVTVNGIRVSSTAVRLALANGQFELAAQLLGRPYHLSGKVAHGDKRGRLLGFPTANLRLKRKTLPLSGVYAVKVMGDGMPETLGVANIGFRPTVDGKEPRCEVHLFNFADEIYGRLIEIEPVQFIRAEQKFSGLDALKAQISVDSARAKQIFNLS